LQTAFPDVINEVLKVLHDLNSLEDEGDDDDDDDEEEEPGIVDLDEDKDNDEELDNAAEYTKNIQNQLSSILEGDVDPENYESPLDTVDPFEFFAHCARHLAASHGGMYQTCATQALTQVIPMLQQRKQRETEEKNDGMAVVMHTGT